MSFSTSRVALRRSRFMFSRQGARNNSTTTSKASGAVSSAASKASEGLSRVTSSTGPAITRAAKGFGNALGKIGGRTGRFITFVEGKSMLVDHDPWRGIEVFGLSVPDEQNLETIASPQGPKIPPTIYYARVGLELSKLVFQGQKMSPPSISTFQQFLQPLVHTIRRPAGLLTLATTNSSNVLGRLRNVNSQQLATTGVVIAEVIGFFTVGEMLGRLKIVGYRGEKPGHH
ncbi:MAG: RNA-dependent ATPase rok1 [Geoglossum simile]|nr:MAG: RNA-dependent ATPase rok1 [Geoglossum simile]